MQLSRKLVVLATVTAAAATFGPASASATDPIQVVNEKTATECSAVSSPHTSGGCVVHASGTVTLEVWVFTWITERKCDIELELRVGGDGTMAIYDLDHYTTESGADSDCATNPPVTTCDMPWEGSGEEFGLATIHLSLAICIDPSEGDICGDTVEGEIVELGSENYSVTGDSGEIGSFCNVSGGLSIESSSTGNATIHVNHL